MRRHVAFLFLLTSLILTAITPPATAHKHSSNPLLLVVSFDGFRWDYLNMHQLPNFNYLKSFGAHADLTQSEFVTLTFPNHWSLATGMHPETHGVISNQMYDPTLKRTFSSGDRSTHTLEWFGQNSKTVPIWAANQRAGNPIIQCLNFL
jgi:ectonucleotide pyrophosphatase/phosphodiesterase family protein 5